MFLIAASEIAHWLLVASLAMAVYRLARGPSLADRVVALDLITVVVVGLVALDAIRSASPILLRPALLLALLGFLATVAFAHHLARPQKDPRKDPGARP